MRFAVSSGLLLVAALSLAGCAVAKAEAESEQSGEGASASQAVQTTTGPKPDRPDGDWTDWDISPGIWIYRDDRRGSIALFGEPGENATFMIRCDENRGRLYLSRAGEVGDNATMTLRASSGLQSFSAYNSGGSVDYVAVTIAPDDIVLDRIAFSRGRFAVETEGLRSIAVPIWPEFTRVVEDCRRGA